MSILDKICAYKYDEIEAAKAATPLYELKARISDLAPVRAFQNQLTQKIAQTQLALIAEIKKASPSKGLIRENFDPKSLARAYENAGAACLSVLTDTPSFQGRERYLGEARAATQLPILRKDFMLDPYQVYQARLWGADCILIIMACVSDEQAKILEETAFSLSMDVLIEVHNEAELTRALTHLNSTLIGINNRDLNSFETNLATSETLARQIPDHYLIVAESGIQEHIDLLQLQNSGIHSFLVGESLMRQADVEYATRRLLGETQS